jgi:hypothetical protein
MVEIVSPPITKHPYHFCLDFEFDFLLVEIVEVVEIFPLLTMECAYSMPHLRYNVKLHFCHVDNFCSRLVPSPRSTSTLLLALFRLPCLG